jgi:hypothetical protein
MDESMKLAAMICIDNNYTQFYGSFYEQVDNLFIPLVRQLFFVPHQLRKFVDLRM